METIPENMKETYEDIVRKWYMRLRGDFTGMLMDRYKTSNLRLEDAENIYQDVFIAIHKNLQEGSIRENTSWASYIMTVGLRMASKQYRHIGVTTSLSPQEDDEGSPCSDLPKKIPDILKALPADDAPALSSDPEALALLGDELTHTPEPCASIIRMFYYGDMSDKEIAAEVSPYKDNGKTTDVNARAVRARRWLCMRDLIYRVKLSLYFAGIIDEKPEKLKRNGKGDSSV